MLLQVNSFQLFLGLHHLLVLLLLQSIETPHQDRHGKEHADAHHKEEERLVISVIRGELRLDLHLVCDVVEHVLSN